VGGRSEVNCLLDCLRSSNCSTPFKSRTLKPGFQWIYTPWRKIQFTLDLSLVLLLTQLTWDFY
jgi:hypothetical protein